MHGMTREYVPAGDTRTIWVSGGSFVREREYLSYFTRPWILKEWTYFKTKYFSHTHTHTLSLVHRLIYLNEFDRFYRRNTNSNWSIDRYLLLLLLTPRKTHLWWWVDGDDGGVCDTLVTVGVFVRKISTSSSPTHPTTTFTITCLVTCVTCCWHFWNK